MFSLLVTIIAIALVVALAVAVIYYGGDTSKKAAVRAAAGTLINQAVQINAAGTVAVSQGASWPTDAPYFAPPFLQAMPVPPKGAYTHDVPAASDWEYFVRAKHTHHFVLRDKVSRDVCMAINKEFGLVGIPAMWTGKDLVQCFGPGVKTGSDDKLSYTFFYDPLGATADDETAALDQSKNDAIDAGVPSPTPGYPRLCPDNTTINEGVCSSDGGGATNPPGPPEPEPDKEGFFVVTATSGDYHPTLVSEGFAEMCPAGAINPTGPGARPLVTNPSEPLNVDGVMRTGWLVQPDWAEIYDTYLTRTWCFPAMKSEALPAGPLANGADGDVTNVTLTPAIAGADPMDYHWASTAATSFVVKGQEWTVLAASFEADVVRSNNADNPWMVGDKLAVGRGSGITATYYGGVPTLSYNGTNYAGETGTIVFTPTAPITPPKLQMSWPGGSGTSGSTVSFSDTPVYTVSAPIPITFRNISSQPVAMPAPFNVSGPFTVVTNKCPTTLSVGASCSISVEFAPSTEGWANGGISVNSGSTPEGLTFQGYGEPPPVEGYWLVQGYVYSSVSKITAVQFSTTCPAGAVNPDSLSATPIAGLPADEALNTDAVMTQEWVSYSEASNYGALVRNWCIPAMSNDLSPGELTSAFAGAVDYQILPNASAWLWSSSHSNIATATIKAKGVTWTMAAMMGQVDGQNGNFTPTSGMSYFVNKVAIGKVPYFPGSYYANGPSRLDGYGTAYTNEGFIRFGGKDPSAPRGLVFNTTYANVYGVVGETRQGSPVTVGNPNPDPIAITGVGVVGAASPFTVSSNCGNSIPSGGQCQLYVTYRATTTGDVYDQYAITTAAKTYTIDLSGSAN